MSVKLADPTKQKTDVEWLEALNHAILTSALDCIITMDAQGRVLEFNPAAERVFRLHARGGYRSGAGGIDHSAGFA